MENHSCDSLLQSLSEFIDGTLNPNLCKDLEEHLATCKNCQVVYNTTLKTIDLYRIEEACDELPGEVRQRLFKRLNLLEISPDENTAQAQDKPCQNS